MVDDWQAVYIDDELFIEDHKIDLWDLCSALKGKVFDTPIESELIEFEYGEEDIVYDLPESLIDFKEKLRIYRENNKE